MNHLVNRKLTGRVRIKTIRKGFFIKWVLYQISVEITAQLMDPNDFTYSPEFTTWVDPTPEEIIKISSINLLK
jgi:hypothetical protein